MEWVEFSHLAHTGMTHFSSVQSLSHVQLFVTPWTAACQAFPVYYIQAMLNQDISQLQTSSSQGGWQLSRRIPPYSLERNELKQLWETQRGGCSLPELTCHGHGLLVGSPKLLTTEVSAPEHSEIK